MQNIDPKMIKSIPIEELTNLWDSGIGRRFCENNKDDVDVLSIKNNVDFYQQKSKKSLSAAYLCFFVFIAIFILAYSSIGYLGKSLTLFTAIASGIVAFGFLVSGISRISKSKKFLESAKKLSNYDLSGFDIEDYVPNKKRLLRKSIEWGLMQNLLENDDGKLTLAAPQSQPKENTETPQ